MSFLEESRVWINSLPFDKIAFYCIERLKTVCLADLVNVTDNRAIELSKYQVSSACVNRHVDVPTPGIVQKIPVHRGDRMNASGCR